MNYEKLETEPKKKRKTKSKAKKDAWAAFSRYVRTRDCLRFSGSPELGKCITCKKALPFKSLQAGHFISGRSNSVLFDERLVYSQCYACNVGRGGAYVEYFVFMEEEWGRIMIDEFRELKNKTIIYKTHDYEEIEEEFKRKTQELLDK